MAKKEESRLERLSQVQKIALVVGMPLVILAIIVGVHLAAKSVVDDYAQAREFPTYPDGDFKKKIDPACQGSGAIPTERCITTVYCTEDSVADVVDYFKDDVELEPAPDILGENTFLAIREKTNIDKILYTLAGRRDGKFLITMSVGDNEYYTVPYDCPDQTVIVSTVAWNTP